MTKRATHILDWKTAAPGGLAATLCGRESGRAAAIRYGAAIAPNGNHATCGSCRAIRDGRRSAALATLAKEAAALRAELAT